MKNTNVKTVKNTKRQIAIVVATALFSLISNSSIVQAAELVKAQPVKQISLYQEAKESLALSFTGLTISQNVNDAATISIMTTQQNAANTSSSVTLIKTNLMSE
jgi:hypothetical protein